MYEKENMVPHLSSKCQASKWLNKGNAPKPLHHILTLPNLEPGNHLEKDWQNANPGPNKHVLYSQQIKSGF